MKEPNSTAVPKLSPSAMVQAFIHQKSRKRSQGKLRDVSEKRIETKVNNFLNFAQAIRVPYTLKSLKQGEKTEKLERLEAICDQLATQPTQCVSARFLDPQGDPLFFYFGRRGVVAGKGPPVSPAILFYSNI
jgi:DNA-binding Xre family transcriptional regulator